MSDTYLSRSPTPDIPLTFLKPSLPFDMPKELFLATGWLLFLPYSLLDSSSIISRISLLSYLSSDCASLAASASFLVLLKRGAISLLSFSLTSIFFIVNESTDLPTYTAIVWSSARCILSFKRTIVPNLLRLSSM